MGRAHEPQGNVGMGRGTFLLPILPPFLLPTPPHTHTRKPERDRGREKGTETMSQTLKPRQPGKARLLGSMQNSVPSLHSETPPSRPPTLGTGQLFSCKRKKDNEMRWT